MPAEYVTFSGLHITRADFVLSHGVTPSRCIVDCFPTAELFVPGPLTFYSHGVPVFAFQDCAVEYGATTPPLLKRGQRVVLHVLDRRWRWKYVLVDGRYNVRRPDSLARTDTRKTYWELIYLLLEGMGEQGFQMLLPDMTLEGPTVNWAGARADLELAKLLHDIGCIVVLGVDNIVRVLPDGYGPLLPPNGRERMPLINIVPNTMPAIIEGKLAPNRYQSKLKLEAVGLDRDHSVVPIDKLTYKPAGGWYYQVPGVFNDVTDPFNRELARMSVWKWYRVKSQTDDKLWLPGGTETIKSIDDLLPLLPDLILPPYYAPSGNESWENWPPCKPWVEGYFFNNDLTGWPEQMGSDGTPSWAFWDDTFELDLQRGIVKFFQSVFLPDSGHCVEAGLTLECAYQARKNVYSTDWYHVHHIQGPGSQGIAQIERPDVFRYNVATYEIRDKQLAAEGGGTVTIKILVYTGQTDNRAWADDIAKRQAESWRCHFTNTPYSSMQWSGILRVPPQGNIHQVRWTVGGGPAMTYASRSSEIPTWSPTYRERRLRESMQHLTRSMW